MASRKELEAEAVKAGVSKEDAEGAQNMEALQGLIDAKSSNASTDNDGRNSADGAANAGGEELKAGGGSQTGLGTPQAPGVPTTPATIIPPAPTQEELERAPGGGQIVRMTRLAWWCPRCDNSNERSLNACGKCGAKVSADGKSVGKAERVG